MPWRRDQRPLNVFVPANPVETVRGWALHSTRRRVIHEAEARHLDRLRLWVGTLAVALSALAGTSAFAAWQGDKERPTLALVTVCVGILAAVLASAVTFLDFGTRAAAHRKAAAAYKAVIRDLEARVPGAPLEPLKAQLAAVDEAAPTVPLKRGEDVEGRPVRFVASAAQLLAGAGAREPKVVPANGAWNTALSPGARTRRHYLDVEERHVIERGTGLAWVGDADPVPLKPGDVVAVPAKTPQQLVNTGTAALVVNSVCSPRLSRQAYHELD
jgi:mannose-6-phosphate isomerase-like protein (cupin superfamily)